MERADFKTVSNYTMPVRKQFAQKQLCSKNYINETGIYPIYSEVPYGINRRNYVKIGQNKLPTGEIANIYKLINGQTVSIVQKADGCPVIQTSFKVGALDEPDGKEGISHLIEHSIYHESSKYSDIDSAIREIGGYSNASTGYDTTTYYIKLSDNNLQTLENALDIEADMLFNPKFSKVESKEKNIVTKEATEYENDESNVLAVQRLKDMFSINKPQIKDIQSGNKESIRSITVDDMLNYHKQYYIPANCSTSIVSPQNPDELIEIVSKKFLEASKNASNHPIQRKQYNFSNHITRSDLISKTELQKNIRIGFPVTVNSKQEEIALTALCKLIANRADLDYDFGKIYGNLYHVAFFTDKDDEYAIFERLKENLADISDNPANEYELERIKNSILENIKCQYSTNEDITGNLSKNYFDGKFNFELEKSTVENLSNSDILKALGSLDISKSSINVLHPKGTKREEIEQMSESYKKYITPIAIPLKFQQLAVENGMQSYNIYPYSASLAKSTILPDNTRFTVINNSKTDECYISQELYNPELETANPAIKYILGNFSDSSTSKDLLFAQENDMSFNTSFLNSAKVIFDFKCKAGDIKEAIRLFRKMFNRKFNEEDFKIAKQDAINTIKSSINNSAYDVFIQDKAGANNIKDKEKLIENIEKVTLDEVKDYYNKLLSGSYSRVCAKIPFESHKGLIDTLASGINIPDFSFKKEEKDMSAKIYSVGEPKCYINEQIQPMYSLCCSSKISGNKQDNIKFNLLNSILSERIFNSLREQKHLGYQAGSEIEFKGDMMAIQPYIVTDLTNENEIKNIYENLYSEIKKITAEPVSQIELQDAKNTLKRNYFDLAESNYNLLDELNFASNVPDGIAQMQGNIDVINSITPQDILICAQYAFKNAPDYLIEADRDTIDKNSEYFKSLAKTVVS